MEENTKISTEDFKKSLNTLGFNEYDKLIVNENVIIYFYVCEDNDIISTLGYDEVYSAFITVNDVVKLAHIDSNVSYSSDNCNIIRNIRSYLSPDKYFNEELSSLTKEFLEKHNIVL